MHFRRPVEELAAVGPNGCGKYAKTGWFRNWDRSRLLIQYAARPVATVVSETPERFPVLPTQGIEARLLANTIT
jgi:hypothetical protein